MANPTSNRVPTTIIPGLSIGFNVLGVKVEKIDDFDMIKGDLQANLRGEVTREGSVDLEEDGSDWEVSHRFHC